MVLLQSSLKAFGCKDDESFFLLMAGLNNINHLGTLLNISSWNALNSSETSATVSLEFPLGFNCASNWAIILEKLYS